MFVVIVRASVGQRDADYVATAACLRELALGQYGCLHFVACEGGDQEIAVSYGPAQDQIFAWREDPTHRVAQRRGSDHWYNGHQVEVAEICRSYRRAGRDGS